MHLLLLLAAAWTPPKGYVCYRAVAPLRIDGKLDDVAWRRAPWSDPFVDIEGQAKPRPRFRTRVKMLWDDDAFYIAAEMEEPHLWATLTKHDAVIFQDNDFEVFLDPDGDSHEYYELEINALNTTWDLFLPRPYKDGGKARNDWEIRGLRSAVYLQGTLNDPRDTDRGWSLELAIPWADLAAYARRPAPPRDGDQWRVNFSRVQWRRQVVDGRYRKVPGLREDNWVWSPQGVINMHRPESWGGVQFSTAPGALTYQPDPGGPARDLLHGLYYAQRDYRKQHGRWAASLVELGVPAAGVTLEPAPDGFRARSGGLEIRQDARVGRARSIEDLRRDIDAMDERLLALLNHRARLALEIGALKKQQALPVVDPRREAEVIRNVTERNLGPLSSDAVRRFFEGLLEAMRAVQQTTVCYTGQGSQPMRILASLILLAACAATGAAQSSEEAKALKKQIEALQKDVDQIKKMLRLTPEGPPESPISIEDAPFAGERNARVTLIEFSDYQCGFCARHLTQTFPQLMAEYIKSGKVKYVLRDFPLASMHPLAAKAAEAAHCAAEQSKYWEMHQRLLTNPNLLAVKDLPGHAKALSLDLAKFEPCLASGKYATRVRRGMQEGEKAGVEGTPTFFFGLTEKDKPVVKAAKVLRGAYPYQNFKEALDSLLASR